MILCIFDNCGTTRPETKPRECRTPLHRPWKAAELGVRHDRRTIQTSKVEPPEFAERTARTDTAVKHRLIKTQFADNGTLRGRLETDEFMEILDVQHRISTRETVGQTETPLFARSVSPSQSTVSTRPGCSAVSLPNAIGLRDAKQYANALKSIAVNNTMNCFQFISRAISGAKIVQKPIRSSPRKNK